MRVCPSCGHENADDVDFCASCGQYVRWEPTRLAPSVTPAEQAAVAAPQAPPAPPAGDGAAAAQQPAAAPAPPAGQSPQTPAPPAEAPPAEAPPAAPEVPPESVLLALRLPEQESATGEPVTANVEAGGQGQIYLLVRNQSGIVDNYDLAVQGIPDHWWTANPGTVYLIPYGTSEQGFEQEVVIHLHPPRAPESEARPWPMAVTAHSRAHGVQVGQADATLEVAPYQEIDSEMRPERKAGRTRARYAVAVRNRANAPINVEVNAVDAGNQTRFEFEHPQFPTRPGRRSGTVFWAKPLKQIWIGRKVEHRFTLEAKTVGYDVAAMPRMGVYVQKPWLPWWLLILLPLVIVAAIALWLLWPRTVAVPNVRTCDNVACAQQLLDSKDLKLGTQTPVKTDRRPPGSPVGSSPATGKKVKKGSTVDIRVAEALGPARIEVPDVVGKTLAEADEILEKAKLTRGKLTPEPDSPDATVTGQVPAAGKRAGEGRAVDLFFEKPPSDTTTTGTGETTTTTAGGGGGGTGGGGTGGGGGGGQPGVIAIEQLRIVFDNGKDILIIPAKTGKPLRTLVNSDEFEFQAAVSPDRDKPLIAYARGPTADKTQIWLVDPARPEFAHALTNPGFRDGRPAFSPDGKVIAFKRETSDRTESDLCFISVKASAAKPSCVVDPEVGVTRPTWSPRGNAIVVVASDKKDNQVELALYTSVKANSGRAKDWNDQGLITDNLHGKRELDSVDTPAWSPDGKQLAFTSNWRSTGFYLNLVDVKEVKIDETSLKPFTRQGACEVSWRPDGTELALVRRDNLCAQTGQIVRFDPKKSITVNTLTKLGLGGQSPVWSTLPLPKPK